MIWSAFALFLARRTKFAFNIGHFLIILPFHSLLATFQVSISLIFYLSWSQCFGWNTSEVVRRSKLRNTFMHRPSFFSFHFLSFLTSFPKLTIFYYFTSLHGLQEVNHHCAYLKEISSCSLVEKFHISAFPMYYSLCNWIGEHEITKLIKKNICFECRTEDTKTSTKRHEWNGLTQNGAFDIFNNARA